MLRLVECRHGNVNGLLQHMLARHRGVHDLIGKAHPCRARFEANDLLPAMTLILQVRFGVIVQAKHQMIVVAAYALGYTKPRQRSCRSRKLRLDSRQEDARHRVEILADSPYSIFARIHIAENAQDTLTLIGPGWKRVDVQSGIILAPGERSPNSRLRSKARTCRPDIRRIA